MVWWPPWPQNPIAAHLIRRSMSICVAVPLEGFLNCFRVGSRQLLGSGRPRGPWRPFDFQSLTVFLEFLNQAEVSETLGSERNFILLARPCNSCGTPHSSIDVRTLCYAITSDSGPEIGLPGQILAGLLPEKNRTWHSVRPSAGRRTISVCIPGPAAIAAHLIRRSMSTPYLRLVTMFFNF